MKILLDECVTNKLLKYLSEFETFTIRFLGLGGVKNGKLMNYCHENKFDILLTIDKNLMFQQNLEKYNVAIEVFDYESSKIEELIKFIPDFKSKIKNFQKRKAHILSI